MSFDDHAGFSDAKMADIGGRELPAADSSESSSGEQFGQAKLEGIGGRSLPKPQQGASTLSFKVVDADKQGKFPDGMTTSNGD